VFLWSSSPPCCHLHAVISMLSPPCCHLHAVIFMLPPAAFSLNISYSSTLQLFAVEVMIPVSIHWRLCLSLTLCGSFFLFSLRYREMPTVWVLQLQCKWISVWGNPVEDITSCIVCYLNFLHYSLAYCSQCSQQHIDLGPTHSQPHHYCTLYSLPDCSTWGKVINLCILIYTLKVKPLTGVIVVWDGH